jgi:hypothetical protein
MIPAEFTTVSPGSQAHFGPRIWLAGRLLRSTSATVFRADSATAPATMILRTRGLRSLQRRTAEWDFRP